jgi:hypothetical protein
MFKCFRRKKKRRGFMDNYRRCTACRSGMIQVFNIVSEEWERGWCFVCDGKGMIRL